MVAAKKKIDEEVEVKKKQAKDFEVEMRKKASNVGNIVNKDVPVSLTEVCLMPARLVSKLNVA